MFYTNILLSNKVGACSRGRFLADPERDESRPGWEPVITRPDPMTAEEWEAWLDFVPAEDTDPDEYPDEEDFLPPDDGPDRG